MSWRTELCYTNQRGGVKPLQNVQSFSLVFGFVNSLSLEQRESDFACLKCVWRVRKAGGNFMSILAGVKSVCRGVAVSQNYCGWRRWGHRHTNHCLKSGLTSVHKHSWTEENKWKPALRELSPAPSVYLTTSMWPAFISFYGFTFMQMTNHMTDLNWVYGTLTQKLQNKKEFDSWKRCSLELSGSSPVGYCWCFHEILYMSYGILVWRSSEDCISDPAILSLFTFACL